MKSLPGWAFVSLAANGLLVLVIAWVLPRQHHYSMSSSVSYPPATVGISPMPNLWSELGPRHQLNYRQWINLLRQEAEAVTSQNPDNLTVLIGDSLSLWFPQEILPPGQTWLNQGISGETSAGLLKRLYLLERTKPKVIFIMIGINDLIGGARNETILANQRLIVRNLRQNYPQAEIVLQSILPHSAETVTWEGRELLLSIPNSRIQFLNQRSQEMALQEGVIFLDLYPLFANAEGNLRNELSTDGLHLSHQGYIVWSNALQVINQVLLSGGLGSRK